MDPRIRLAAVDDSPIDPAHLSSLVERPSAGAVNLFVGMVRDHDRQAEGQVVGLTYTCHPTAPGVICEIAEAVVADHDPDGDVAVATAHRIGELRVGDVAFAVAVSAPHRELSFNVCQALVDRVKAELPIWKQQFEAGGGYRWSGL